MYSLKKGYFYNQYLLFFIGIIYLLFGLRIFYSPIINFNLSVILFCSGIIGFISLYIIIKGDRFEKVLHILNFVFFIFFLIHIFVPILMLGINLIFGVMSAMIGLLYILFSTQIYLSLRTLSKIKNCSDNEEHTAIIVAHYKIPFRNFSFVGIDVLLNGFSGLKLRKVPGLIDYEKIKIYHCDNIGEIPPIIKNRNVRKIWIFGHGIKHGLDVNGDTLYYCDFENVEKKDFIAQMHCNPCGGKSLCDYLLENQDADNCIINDSFRDFVLNSRDIKNILINLQRNQK